MALRQMTYMGCVAAVMAGGLGAATPSDATGRLVVHSGESIQRAVDAARPGDTIKIRPGEYRENVVIDKSGLHLVGSGKVVIRPPGTRARDACGAQSGSGICVVGRKDRPVRDVTLRGLTVEGFARNGIWASDTERLSVIDVAARKNGVWGIAQQKSTRGVIKGNDVTENGDAGVFVANTVTEEGGAPDLGGTRIEHNRMWNNRIGLTVRRVRNLTVAHNSMTGNCGGLFIVGDESRPRAGELTVRDNDISRNNKQCPATKRLPALQGSGIVLTGTEKARVVNNRIQGNAGKSPLSGGVVVFQSFVKALSENNDVLDNTLTDNEPADLVNGDTKGKGNRFSRNYCRTSKPAGLCGKS
ncbi:nitrous oxide reductase family maturation protein NosD [Streptomyces sp. NBRC 110611]|uniref:right-handed parallel beta-helix repeat-containing protein n=1 Tax=Streptomyces sp. NBRC 110611 TaxID=1621259 RepID=UPI0008364FBF|nr:right-handed parallel beta-helix repeat-containing protein [Streptomyces sp. NBRC 110611]